MSEMFLQMAAAIITFTLAVHFVAVTFQLGYALNDGLRSRSLPNVPSLAAMWQNIGIALALIGFVEQDTQLMVFGCLFVGLRLALLPLRAPSWDIRTEQPLLVLAMISLGLLAAVHLLPRIGA